MDELRRRLQRRLQEREEGDAKHSRNRARGLAEWLEATEGLTASRSGERDGCWIIRYDPGMLWDGRPPQAGEFSPLLEDAGHAELQFLAEHEPAAWTFLDTETLGLRSVPVFLVGYLAFSDGRPSVTQVLAENTSEEGAMLRTTARRLQDTSAILSFNGKSFDMPLLEKRAGRWGVKLPTREDYLHVDLLTHSRRLWRSRLPNCKLSTVESRICGRQRGDDVPGSQVPRLYRLFTETGDARLLAPILRHNAIDVASLVDVLGAMTGEEAGS